MNPWLWWVSSATWTGIGTATISNGEWIGALLVLIGGFQFGYARLLWDMQEQQRKEKQDAPPD